MKERYCPWCDRKYETKGDKSGPLCDECRQDLMEQPKEFLVDKLGHVAGVNALAMAALRGSPHLLEEFGLTSSGPEEADGARCKLTLKELTKEPPESQLTWIDSQRTPPPSRSTASEIEPVAVQGYSATHGCQSASEKCASAEAQTALLTMAVAAHVKGSSPT